jgi:hypothetical protein
MRGGLVDLLRLPAQIEEARLDEQVDEEQPA